MISKHRVLALLLFSSLGCAALAHMAAAAPFTSGNILVTYSNALHEYTLEGEWVQSIPIPHPGSDRYNVTDSVTDRLGRIHLGSSASLAMSFLTTFDPSDGSFRHTPDPTFYLGNVSDGDLTILGDFVWTRNSRLDLRDFSVTNVTVPELSRVGELSIGLDGLLYALSSGSPRPYVHVMDPLTMAGVRELVLRDSAGFRLDARGIAVPENGELYVADWDGRIYHYTPDGVYIEDVLTGGGNMLDINVSPDRALGTLW